MFAWQKRCLVPHLSNYLFVTVKKLEAATQNGAASSCKHTADVYGQKQAGFQEDEKAVHCTWIAVFQKVTNPLVVMRM